MKNIPYTYKILIDQAGKKLTYIGLRIEEDANPVELRKGYIPNVASINKVLKNGGIVVGTTALAKFDNTEEGIAKAFDYTNELLSFLNVAKDDSYINGCNYIKSTTTSTYSGKLDYTKDVKVNKKSASYPFVIVATHPNGKVTKHTFDAKQPSIQCRDFGINASKQVILKRGETVTIHKVNSLSTHPFPPGTKLTLKPL